MASREEPPVQASKKVDAVWTAAWKDATGRAELARRVRRVEQLDGDPQRLEALCRNETFRSLRAEIAEQHAIVGSLRETLLLAAASLAGTGLLVALAILGGAVWLRLLAGVAAYVTAILCITGVAQFFEFLRRRRRSLARLRSKIDGLFVPLLRRRLSDRLRVPFACLEVTDMVGLSEVVDVSLEVNTEARTRLTALFERMRSGCIGVSGPRGAGKTTLIRTACGGRLTPEGLPPTLGVRVPAPVQWQATEFVPYLFGELCSAVAPWLDEGGAEPRRRRRQRLLAAGLLGVASVVLFISAVRVAAGGPLIRVDTNLLLVLALGVGAWVAFGAGLALVPNRGRREPPLSLLADRRMRELRYRKTIVEGWSLGASSKLGPSLARKRESTATQQPVTLPEIVGRYRAFVERVAREHTLVIGIDELDKMSSAQEAADFLRDVKVLFGEQHCFYLVSLSDDAMSEFERRGLPVRTVFDSSFDDVLHVDALSWEESQEIVNGRVVGMGDAFAALCHVMSGGVPRELIRSVRAVVTAHDELKAATAASPTPSEVAQRVTLERLQRIERAVQTVGARHVAADGRHPLLAWLDGLGPATAENLPERWSVAAPYAALARAPQPERDAQRLLLLELAVVAYRVETTIRLWAELDESDLRPPPEGVSKIELLARAWQDLAHGPAVAWEAVNAARQAIDPATQLPFPLSEEPAVVPLWKRGIRPAPEPTARDGAGATA